MAEFFSPLSRRIILAIALGSLLLLGAMVLQPFIIPAVWAMILAYVTWPLYRHLQNLCGARTNLSALLMTLALSAAFVLPLLWMINLLRDDLTIAYRAISDYINQGPQPLPESVRRVPWLGNWLQDYMNRWNENPDLLKQQLAQWVRQSFDELGVLVGGVGRNLFKFSFALLTVFFLYRDGEIVLAQSRRVLRQFLGERGGAYLQAVAVTLKAVVYGLVLTALAQGFLAGLGYWVAGIEAAVLLGAVTALVALIPFGTPLVWGSIAISLLLKGQLWAGIGLLIWGAVVVSWVDNLIRPLVISSATRIPFLLVLFGVLGGIAAFGLVGLFVGPAILAVLMAVWREWLHEQQPHDTAVQASEK